MSFEKMSHKDYLALKHISSSAVKSFLKSPKHFEHEYVLGLRDEPSDSMNLGTAFHDALLLNKQPIIKPDVDGRTKEGKDVLLKFNEQFKNETIISKQERYNLEKMLQAVSSHEAATWALKDSIVESVGVFLQDDQSCKFRPDALNLDRGLIVDLKTTRDASLSNFGYQARSLKYNIQAAFYQLGVEHVLNRTYDFVFIAVENKPPFNVAVYSMNQEDLERDKQLVIDTIKEMKKCIELNEYCHYNKNDIMEIRFYD